MSEPLLTKRLHISGLTPSLTAGDLERRLSSFGKVTAMDGFGARDAFGDPRKFGFMTMEIGAKELAKCLNVLNGSTWKGAKLRIGEAKPDFLQRLAKVNAQPPQPIRSKPTYTRNHGYPSSTIPLSPLSATAAASTPGWVATPSGRVVRPMRMRPERPLGPVRNEFSASKTKSKNGKVKKRIKPPAVRARRRLIDPTKWDSVYLKGVFLDAVPVPLRASADLRVEKNHGADGEDEEGTDVDSDAVSTLSQRGLQERSRTVDGATSPRIREGTESVNVRHEANAALAMLGQMFGDNEDWDRRQSEAEDDEMQMNVEDAIGIIPRDLEENKRSKTVKKGKDKGKDKSAENVVRLSPHVEVDLEAACEGSIEMENVSPEVSAQTAEPLPRTNLKALFAPMKDALFSLANHLDLDLDLELGADVLGTGVPSGTSQENGQQILSAPQVVEIPTKSTTKARSRVTLDPSLPLLFPIPDLLPHSYGPLPNPTAMTHQRNMPSCFLFPSTTRVRSLRHLPSSATFTRSPQDTSESIRESWEKDKAVLTHEWKKAWRETRGGRRGRRGAVGADIGGGY